MFNCCNRSIFARLFCFSLGVAKLHTYMNMFFLLTDIISIHKDISKKHRFKQPKAPPLMLTPYGRISQAHPSDALNSQTRQQSLQSSIIIQKQYLKSHPMAKHPTYTGLTEPSIKSKTASTGTTPSTVASKIIKITIP